MNHSTPTFYFPLTVQNAIPSFSLLQSFPGSILWSQTRNDRGALIHPIRPFVTAPKVPNRPLGCSVVPARATVPPLIREFRIGSLESDPCRLSLLLLFVAWRGIQFFSPQAQWAYAAPPSPVCTVDPVLARRTRKLAIIPHILLNIITI